MRTTAGITAPQIRALLDAFVQRRKRVDTAEKARACNDRKRIDDLMNVFQQAGEMDRRNQIERADDFNLLEVMQLTGNEIRHSMVLAWLLDRDLRKLGTHAQGSVGFRLFLEEFDLPLSYAGCNYWVRREVAGEKSIVDIEVGCLNQFLIHIENKIWSCEGTDQTDREWSDLQRRAAELGVSARNVHALFLTPNGTKPKNDRFHPISWGRVVRVLEKFAERAKPVDVQFFARHYAQALRRFVVTQDTIEDDNAERILE